MTKKELYKFHHDDGMKVADIARKFKVSTSTVWGALNFDRKYKSHGYH